MERPADGAGQEDACSALGETAERVSELIRSLDDPHVPVRRSQWTVGDVAAHLALMSEFYLAGATGDVEPFVDVSDIAAGSLTRSSAARLEAEPERDLARLADRLRQGVSALVRAAEGRNGEDPVMWNGLELPLGAVLGIALGECLLHGLDIAETTSRPWQIGAHEARLVQAAMLPRIALLLDRRATARIRASYDVHVRGGTRVTVRIDHGQAIVEGPGGTVDCHVSADPVSLLLIAYGRRSQWGPVLAGKVAAWGRKPWLGLRLTHYLVPPR
jgi:uncharacterized protein (TIGR03083 family)